MFCLWDENFESMGPLVAEKPFCFLCWDPPLPKETIFISERALWKLPKYVLEYFCFSEVLTKCKNISNSK